jgi:hypothetical protein
MMLSLRAITGALLELASLAVASNRRAGSLGGA